MISRPTGAPVLAGVESVMEVRPCGVKGHGVFALADLDEGAVVGRFDGEAGPRTRTTLQFGHDLHIQAPATGPLPWINHSCDPTLDLHDRELRVRRRVRVGEELTLDYTLYESELSHPFRCRCGSAECLGEVRGFLHLDERARAVRRSRFPVWVRAVLAARF
jgi:hypothetical protein